MKKLTILKVYILSSVFLFIEVCPCYSEIYKEKAIVSYYAGDFHGKKTSNGEYFNMNDMTCASKNLPFDSILKVTNLTNGLSVNVRVNDRGPFIKGRELDLSKAAAKKLDMITTGTATVKIEIVKRGPNTKLSQKTAEKAAQIMVNKYGYSEYQGQTSITKKYYPSGTLWDIQIGAYTTKENANVVAQKLLQQGFTNVIFQKKDNIVRVVIKGVPSEEIQKVESALNKKGYEGYVIRERKKL